MELSPLILTTEVCKLMKCEFLESFAEHLQKVDPYKIENLKNAVSENNGIIIIGNGGSNAVASHISQDYTKFLKKQSFTFSDPSRLTCYINDYGMEEAYRVFLKEFVSDSTLVILISSSGNSDNIYNCADFCKESKIPFILLTGFSKNNRLRNSFSSDAIEEFWVDSNSYGIVECLHQVILHAIV